MEISLGICNAPLLKVGVEQREQELPYSFGADTLLLIVGEGEFGVFSLGKLALAAVFEFHESSCVAVNGLFPAECVEKFNVHWER